MLTQHTKHQLELGLYKEAPFTQSTLLTTAAITVTA